MCTCVIYSCIQLVFRFRTHTETNDERFIEKCLTLVLLLKIEFLYLGMCAFMSVHMCVCVSLYLEKAALPLSDPFTGGGSKYS